MNIIDKITKSNKIMGLVSIATLAIVAYVLVYKPWKESQPKQQNYIAPSPAA